MRRGRIFFYLAFILILLLVAVVVVWVRFFQPATFQPAVEATPVPIVTVNVVSVTQRVPRGDVIEERMLAMVPIPQDHVLPGYFMDLAQVIGRRARVDLEAGMLLTTGMVADTADQLSATGSNAALSIPRGMVAVSIPIDMLSSVSYAPQPGDHVNVIVNLLFVDVDTDYQSILPNTVSGVTSTSPFPEGGDPITASVTGGGGAQGRVELEPLLEQPFYITPSERQRPRLVSQMLLQDAVVLHVGLFPPPEEEKPPTPTPAPDQPEAAPVDAAAETVTPDLPNVITLIVTPQDAITLNYLIAYTLDDPFLLKLARAKLTLALRSAGDDTRVQTEATTLDFLLQQYNIPIPVKLPYSIEPRPVLPSLQSPAPPEPTE